MTQPMTDPYAILGIPRDASERQVRQAYRRLAMRYHPDRHPDERTSERMQQINDAWHTLSSTVRRRRFDAAALRPATQGRTTPSTTAQPAGDQAGSPGLGGALGILAVAWLVLGTILLGFLPAPIIGLALLAAARLILGGILRR